MHTSDKIGTSALPRSISAPGAARRRFGRFELDEANSRLLRDGKAVALAPKPFAVLCMLSRQPGALLSKNTLLDEVWGHQFVSDAVLKTVISELRTLLDDDARQPRFIETVSRRGYRFIAAVNSSPNGSLGLAAIAANDARQAAPFIGREEELSRLHRAWDGACGGRCEMVWIAGEPGIGKTRLVEQFVGSLADVACVRGHSWSTTAPASLISRFSKPSRSYAASTVAFRPCCVPWRRPGFCSCRG